MPPMVSAHHHSLVRVTHISKTYHLGYVEVHALKRISLCVDKGEFLAIAGESGSGKSTLLSLLGFLDRPSEGEIYLEGNPTSDLPDDHLAKLRAHKIGFIFQNFNLIPTLTALENVEYPLVLNGFGFRQRRQLALEALERVGLSKFKRHRPAELSGGQRQRVAIARAIVKAPAIILADEATANLDRKTAASVLDLIEELNRKDGMTFIFSSHDPLVLSHAGRVFELVDGREEKRGGYLAAA